MTEGLPPLSIDFKGATDWHRKCDSCDDGGRISPADVLKIRDRNGKTYCRGCALETDPAMAALANALEHSWQLILGQHEATHFYETPVILRAMANTIESYTEGDARLHERHRLDAQTATTVRAIRHQGWEPPYENWPAGDDEADD